MTNKHWINVLDEPGGHMLIGIILLATLITAKVFDIDGGLGELLAGLIGLSLGRSLKKANDGQ